MGMPRCGIHTYATNTSSQLFENSLVFDHFSGRPPNYNFWTGNRNKSLSYIISSSIALFLSVLSRGQDFYQRRNGLGLISWAKRQGLYWKNIGPRSELQYGPSAASSAHQRPRADQFPLYGSQASLVNKRFQYHTTEDVKKKIPLSRTVKTP